MQGRLGLPDVGPLADQGGGQRDRQLARQSELGKADMLAAILMRQPAEIGHQLIALLRQLLLQRGERCLGLRQRRLLRQHVRFGDGADVELALDPLELIGLRLDDLLGRGDLIAQRGVGDRSGHDIGGQREIGRFHPERLVVRLRLQRLDLAAGAAPQIERIADADGGTIECVERGLARPLSGLRGRGLRALGRSARAYLWKQRSLLRQRVLARGPQRILRSFNVRMVANRLLDKGVDLPGMKQRPPGAGQVAPGGKTLRIAARRRRTSGRSEPALGRVAGRGRRVRRHEVRPDGAGREQHAAADEAQRRRRRAASREDPSRRRKHSDIICHKTKPFSSS